MPAFLSIVIPTYNSYGLMEKLLDSLEKQTSKDFEIVIADDCSADESYLRLFEYSARTEMTMRVYQNETNKGPGAARNLGLSKAIGEYITFVDSDDYVTYDFVEKIQKCISGNPTDILFFDYNKMEKNKVKYIFSYSKMSESGIADVNDAAVYASSSCWGKVYRREMLKNAEISFPEIMRHEDFCFEKSAFLCCNSAFYLRESLYNYLIRPGSVMNSATKNWHVDALAAFKILEEHFGQSKPEQVEAVFVLLCIYSNTIRMAIDKAKKREIKAYLTEMEALYPNCYENKYISGFPKHTRKVIKACKKHKISTVKFYAFLKKCWPEIIYFRLIYFIQYRILLSESDRNL